YTYIPFIGVFLLLAWGAYDLAGRVPKGSLALPALGVVAVTLCAALTRTQVQYWKDSESLFRHALTATKNNEMAHQNLGSELLRQRRIDEALIHYRESARLTPDDPRPQYNLGIALLEKGLANEAIPHLQQAVKLKPDYAAAQRALTDALARTNRTEDP